MMSNSPRPKTILKKLDREGEDSFDSDSSSDDTLAHIIRKSTLTIFQTSHIIKI